MSFSGSGAAGGALTGASMGSMGGLPGMILGGLVGGGLGGFGGQKDQFKKYDTMSSGQKNIFNQLINMLGGGGQIGQGYQGAMNLQNQYMDPSSQAVNQFADPYMRQFEQQTIPGLAERFAGMGALGGGLSSSGFGQSLSSAGGNLQSQLAALKAGLGQQAAQSLMGQYGNMTNQVLGMQPFAYGFQPGSPSIGQSAFSSYAKEGFPGMSQGLQDFGKWWNG